MSKVEFWFVTGSQHLYGPETLAQVGKNSQAIAAALNQALGEVGEVVFKPVLTDSDAVVHLINEAQSNPNCAGLIVWMHTFSPAKMWIRGLTTLHKPLCHLHTQFNAELPWQSIDMDFMNLNQAAHGDREAGHMHARLGLRRRVIVGHWGSTRVQGQLESWMRVAAGWHDLQGARFARFGDNMRFVAVTEGDKVAAETQFGFSVNGYGLGDLTQVLNEVSDAEINALVSQYADSYEVDPQLLPGGDRHESLRDAARYEAGIRSFLVAGGFKGFTTTFEDLHGLNQLPGFACQRLMADGYGFGAEGDWKTAALLRFSKAVTKGQTGGTSFMEDYTYHLADGNEQVLGAHMLEICPTISNSKPRVEIHPLGIGGKSDPVRLVFDSKVGSALNASLVDLGHRFRLLINTVKAVEVPPMPNLPVARALWEVEPNFADGVAAWIYAGGAHHTVYSYDLTVDQLLDFAEISGIEAVVIDGSTNLRQFRNELRWNEQVYKR